MDESILVEDDAGQLVPSPAPTPQQPLTTQIQKPSKQPVILPQVNRSPVIQPPTTNSPINLTSGDFDKNMGALLNRDLEIANHDRAMATALLKVHLDRADGLDQLQLSMPVATVIADNTGACLKSLELAMKAGERVHKIAELMVAAKKGEDATMIAGLKIKLLMQGKNPDPGDGWDGSDLPPQ